MLMRHLAGEGAAMAGAVGWILACLLRYRL